VSGMTEGVMPVLVLIGCAAGGCGGGAGEPFRGDVSGTIGGEAFTPTTAIARNAQPPNDQFYALELQFSDAALDCQRYLGSPRSPGEGRYAWVKVKQAVVGSSTGQTIDLTHLVRVDGTLMPKPGIGATDAAVTLSTVDADRIDGTVGYTGNVGGQAYAFNGGFSLKRCR